MMTDIVVIIDRLKRREPLYIKRKILEDWQEEIREDQRKKGGEEYKK